MTAIAAGGVQTCALLTDSTVRCWGGNDSGQLGNGTTTSSAIPVSVIGMTGVTAIAAGGPGNFPFGHTCALMVDGSVGCWGYNTYGQLGNGATTDASAPVAVTGLGTVTAVVASDYYTCALLTGGTVECWGDLSGSLRISRSSTPVAVLSAAIDVAVGKAGPTCALLTTGSVECRGLNFVGQLGNGTTNDSMTPVPVIGVSDAKAVAAGDRYACALLTGGDVDCWGLNGYGQLGNGTTRTSLTAVAVSGLSRAKAITLGDGHACALLIGGTVECWGENNYGQLGNGTTTNSRRPVSVSGLSCGGQQCCPTGLTYCGGICTLLDTDSANCSACGNQCPSGRACINGQCDCSVGQSSCSGTCSWLLSDSANCGDCGSPCPSGSACSVGKCCPTGQSTCGGVCTSIASDAANCGLCANACPSGLCGEGQCCSSGQSLCNGACTSLTIDPANCGTCGNICATGTCSGGQCSCSATCNGRCAWLEGDPANCGACGNKCPDGDLCSAGTCVDSAAVPVAIDAGEGHTCVLLAGGIIECWGNNTYGQLGNGTTTNSLMPTIVAGVSGATALDSGLRHTCALLGDGSVECWGDNVSGQLANATVLYSAAPLPIVGLPAATAVAAGGSHTCTAHGDGTVRCWGHNNYGQIGTSTLTSSTTTPTVVQGISDAIALSAGLDGTCATRAGGGLSCWGYDATTTTGPMGLSIAAASATPVSRASSGVAIVSVGGYHTCDVMTGGGMNCWGAIGRLGNGSIGVGINTFSANYYNTSPQGLPPVQTVSAGDAHTCVVTKFGQVETWGSNAYWQLGHPSCDVMVGLTGYSISVPCPVTIAAATVVTAGSQHSCAILKDHSISCWGFNSTGQLGNGTTTNSQTPVVVEL